MLISAFSLLDSALIGTLSLRKYYWTRHPESGIKLVFNIESQALFNPAS
jgi:hypothetical protein